MKTIIMFFVFILCCSACSYKDISRGTQLTEATMRAKLVPRKSYEIILNSGVVFQVIVKDVDSLNIYGQQTMIINHRKILSPYRDSYSELHKNASSISVKKFDPGLAALFILIDAFAIAAVLSTNPY
jgi:hypothetical protein